MWFDKCILFFTMVSVNPKRILKLPHALKLVELVSENICLLKSVIEFLKGVLMNITFSAKVVFISYKVISNLLISFENSAFFTIFSVLLYVILFSFILF